MRIYFYIIFNHNAHKCIFIDFFIHFAYIRFFVLCLLPPNTQKTALLAAFHVSKHQKINIANYLILATFLATLATLPTFAFNVFIPFANSASSAGPIFSAFNALQQCGHFVASLLTDCWQYGHVRVVTGAFARAEFAILTIINTANIVIRKLITVFKKVPRFNVVAPAAAASAMVL